MIIEIESQEEYDKYTQFNGNRVVAKFWATWCGPCKAFAPHFERAADNADEITFLSVDVDKHPWSLLDCDVRSVPTVKLYENGTFVRNIKAPQAALPFLNDIRS